MTASRVMVILGGSSGIGAATARLAAESGYRVLLTYSSNAQMARDLVDEISAAGGAAHAMQCDSRNEQDIVALFAHAASLGEVATLVYSSGITGPASKLADVTAETLREVIDVNLTGAMLCAREAVRVMSNEKGGKGGSIIFISSRASDRGSSGEYVWYAASKGGVNSFALGLAREVAKEGIRVNCISPGPIATEMLTPERQTKGAAAVAMGRVGQPSEVASAVIYLASEDASYVTAANLAVAGGA